MSELVADTDQYQIFRDYDSVAGTETFRTVPKAGKELANRMQTLQRARAAVQKNKDFLAIDPTTLTLAQIRNQVISLTKECQALILSMLDDFTDVNGT